MSSQRLRSSESGQTMDMDACGGGVFGVLRVLWKASPRSEVTRHWPEKQPCIEVEHVRAEGHGVSVFPISLDPRSPRVMMWYYLQHPLSARKGKLEKKKILYLLGAPLAHCRERQLHRWKKRSCLPRTIEECGTEFTLSVVVFHSYHTPSTDPSWSPCR